MLLDVREDDAKLVAREKFATRMPSSSHAPVSRRAPTSSTSRRTPRSSTTADYVDEGGEIVAPAPAEGVALGDGSGGELRDVGPSSALRTATWITSGLAVGLFGTSLVTYKLAGDQHHKLVEDSTMCGQPPCRRCDDSFGERVQTLGNRYDTIYKVTLGFGIATAGVAGYLWYRNLHHHKQRMAPASPSVHDDNPISWTVAPTIGDHFAGATAAAAF